MANQDAAILRRLRTLWSDARQAVNLDNGGFVANQLRAMTFPGMKRFVRWWLARLHELPVHAMAFALTIRTIIRLMPQDSWGSLRFWLQRIRHGLAKRLTGLLSHDERRRLMGLEASMVHVLLRDWNNL